MLGDFLHDAVPERLGANAFEVVLHLVQAGLDEDASAATASARISGAAFLAWICSTIGRRCARSSVLRVAGPERPLRRTRWCAPNGRIGRKAERPVLRPSTIRHGAVWPKAERPLSAAEFSKQTALHGRPVRLMELVRQGDPRPSHTGRQEKPSVFPLVSRGSGRLRSRARRPRCDSCGHPARSPRPNVHRYATHP